ncbi:MAG: cytochrome c biogenesis protein ResB [Desulfobacterales bacterium]|nr:cytochrome c biogenesis protein ResB [Desulfobacterales bacterium]MDX2513020.1 cytochrome c biogenesis protein ResB [Desulfobacterales bacterium]
MADKNPIWKLFVSIRLTVVLLLSLAVTSIIGTLVPQNASAEAYFHKYGAFLYRLFDILNIFDMYHSWWFQLLLLLLICNIIACSIDRLAGTWKLIFPKETTFKPSTFQKLKKKENFTDSRLPEELETEFTAVFTKAFGHPRVEKTDQGFSLFAEKWRWTRLGVYIVHSSILFLIAGAMIGSMFGFEGYVNIPEGESVDHVQIRNTGRTQHLGFEIQCNDFELSTYKNGSPKEYRSSLTILENGKPVLTKDIIVNDPLHYKGISLFQSSYGEVSPEHTEAPSFSAEDIQLAFFVNASGMVYKRTAEIGKPLEIPEGMGKFVVMDFKESALFMGQNIGAALVGILTPEGGEPAEVTLPIEFPNFDKMRRGDVVISVVHQHEKQSHEKNPEKKRYYTGLQVVKDPGVWVVYSGFIVMIAGIIITFFMSHQRLCVDVSRKGNKSRIMVAGIANKNKLGMGIKVEKIARLLGNPEK